MEYLLILGQVHTLLRKSHARLLDRYRGLRLSLKGYEPKLRASVKITDNDVNSRTIADRKTYEVTFVDNFEEEYANNFWSYRAVTLSYFTNQENE